jgi:hypothetical protein
MRLPMSRILLSLAGLLLVFGPVIVLLGGGLTAGVMLFSAGVILLGVHGLTEGRDRTVGWVLVFVGATAVAAEVVRALLP